MFQLRVGRKDEVNFIVIMKSQETAYKEIMINSSSKLELVLHGEYYAPYLKALKDYIGNTMYDFREFFKNHFDWNKTMYYLHAHYYTRFQPYMIPMAFQYQTLFNWDMSFEKFCNFITPCLGSYFESDWNAEHLYNVLEFKNESDFFIDYDSYMYQDVFMKYLWQIADKIYEQDIDDAKLEKSIDLPKIIALLQQNGLETIYLPSMVGIYGSFKLAYDYDVDLSGAMNSEVRDMFIKLMYYVYCKINDTLFFPYVGDKGTEYYFSDNFEAIKHFIITNFGKLFYGRNDALDCLFKTADKILSQDISNGITLKY